MIFKDTQVEILFFSDPSINGKGFNLTYNQQIDGKVILEKKYLCNKSEMIKHIYS